MTLFVTCIGLVCPVGYTAASAAAAMRAGIPAFAELGYRDAADTPIVGATVEGVPPKLRGRARLIALLRILLEELEVEIAEALPWERMPLILCTRETERPGARLASIVSELGFPQKATFGAGRAAHVASGSPSVFQALAIARAHLERDPRSVCLVLAVDSLIDARSLDWLDRTHRLKTSERTDGLIPGEAACLAVVARAPLGPGAVAVHGLGAATESATVLNEEPFRADGMTAALGAALAEARLGMHEVDFRLSDVAGESYAFEELVLAQSRLMRRVRERQPLWHPAECIGDCGAASGLVQLAWAGQAFARGYAPGAVAALHAASAFGARAAAIVGAVGRAHA